MTESEGRLHKAGANVDFWYRVSRAVIWFVLAVWAAWVQFLGPGLRSSAQDFLGMTEVIERLEFVEQFMPPPRVVDWNEGAIRQIGDCTSERCLYLLNGSRTEYGEDCGRPSELVPTIRTASGQNIRIGFGDFAPVELSREPTSFTVPFVVPSYLEIGDHEVRVRITYPHCQGRGEPIPRYTPWFPLQVTK